MILSAGASSRRSARPMIAAATIVVGAGLLLSTACVSSGKYRTLEQDRDALDGKYKALQGQMSDETQKNQSLAQSNESLAQQKSALDAEKAAVEKRLAEVEERERALGMQLQQTEGEANRLKSTYDGLVGSLKKELEAGQIQVQQLRDGLSVNVAQEILFASGSATLDKSGSEVLTRVGEQLKQTNYQIVVTGHTDNKPIGAGLVGRYPTNWELAGARAASVVRLFADSGIVANRLLAVSMADTHPVAPNDTPEGRAKNRRIEIRLRPVAVE